MPKQGPTARLIQIIQVSERPVMQGLSREVIRLLPVIGNSPRAALSPARQAFTSAWTSAMKTWKCTRRFFSTSEVSKNRSISADLPRPTGPQK